MTLIRQLFTQPNSVRGASIILAVTLFISNILGVVRDHFLAQKVPAATLDVYYAAFRWPDLLFNIIILGAVSSAFIPVFASMFENDKRRAMAIANTLILILSFLVLVLALVMSIFMPFLMQFVAPGFDAEKMALAVHVTRILLIGPFFFGLSYIFSGMLQTWQRFLVPSLSPLVYNGSIIMATLLFADMFSVVGVAWGVVVGAILHASVQIPALLVRRWNPFLFTAFFDEQIKKIVKLMAPRAIGLGVNQIVLFVFTSFASLVGPGAIAIYNLSDNIQTTPTAIIANAIAGALFPTLSRYHAQNNQRRFAHHIERGLMLIMVFLIPISFGAVLLRSQVIRLILGSGYFGWEETIAAANTLGGFAIGLTFAGIVPLLSRSFYARHNTVTPTVISVIGSVISILLGYILSKLFGVVGLSLAFSGGMFVTAMLLFWVARQSVIINYRAIVDAFLRIITAAVVMSIVVQLVKNEIGTLYPLETGLAVLVQFTLATLAGMIVYLFSLYILRLPIALETVGHAKHFLLRRIRNHS